MPETAWLLVVFAAAALLMLAHGQGLRLNFRLARALSRELEDVLEPTATEYTWIGGAIGFHADYELADGTGAKATATLLPRHSPLYLPIAALVGGGFDRLPADIGYVKGVPMGGDLRNAPYGKAPTFLVAALKDPYSGNLDRIQIVKGWLDANGERQEEVYDVEWSGDRKPGADGKLPPVGNTVDVANATWTNTIGAPELITVWKDPDFNPDVPAVYYARVLEIPTPRWTAYEAAFYGVTMPDEVPMVTQERAYTSPIWYTP